MERVVQNIFFVLTVIFATMSQGQAQERTISEYQYDEIGNTVSRSQEVSTVAPSISNVSPAIVRRNQTLTVTLTGVGLTGAQLGEQNDFFAFSDIVSSNEELSFTLAVDQDADEGSAQVSVSTGLGEASFSLNVLAELPDLRVSGTPITLTPGIVRVLNLSLSFVDVLDHSVAVSVADNSIATVSTAQISFAQGSVTANQEVSLSALSTGNTSLTFASETLGTYVFNLRVTDDVFVLTPGSVAAFNSQAVGLNKLFIPPPPPLINQGPFFAELQINKLVTVQDIADVNSAIANPVGLLKGAYHLLPEPKAVGSGANAQQIIIQGRGLASVTAVELIPSENAVVSDLTADSSGGSISFALSVTAGTPLALRKVILRSSAGTIEPASANDNRIYIGGSAPVIESISPIFLNRGDVSTIAVRGVDLETVRGLRFDNGENLAASNVRVAPDGLSLTFGLEVQGFAIIGPRALILESLLGDSTTLSPAANVINIEDRPPRVLTPVVSAAVGVSKLTASPEVDTPSVVRANAVGVNRGSLLSAIAPNSRSQGSSVSIAISGEGLNTVVSAEFEPLDGITVNEFTPSQDGESATLTIDIANDATVSARRLRLLTGSGALPSLSGADQFTVTLPRPQITSVSPLLIDRSQNVVPITIRGELLDEASLLTITPIDGIAASSPVVSADGRSVQVSLTLSPDAPLGQRILQLTSPGGVTESVAMVSNTIQVVDSISNVITPILSANVGVIRERDSTPIPNESQAVFSGTLGVDRQIAVTPSAQTRLSFGNSVGLTKGPSIFTIVPSSVSINAVEQIIEVTGINLDDLTTVQTIPADGVTLSGPAVISSDGTRVTFTATVAADAPQIPRRLELLTTDGSIPFVSPENSQLRITGLQPEIESINPIQEVPGASFTMTIRGINLNEVQSIQATPPNGVQFDTAVAATDGRSLTVLVVIAPTAAAEPRVITVTTSAGTTISAAMPANIFTVVNDQ